MNTLHKQTCAKLTETCVKLTEACAKLTTNILPCEKQGPDCFDTIDQLFLPKKKIRDESLEDNTKIYK